MIEIALFVEIGRDRSRIGERMALADYCGEACEKVGIKSARRVEH
jgi:hypothetical protein